MQGSCSSIFPGIEKSWSRGEKKLGKWVTRPSAFLARQRCRCAAKAAGREISTGLTAGKGKKEKHWGKLCPV